MDYIHRLEPFAHQLKEFLEHRDDTYRALWWEMGTGKTKPTIDTIAWLYLTGKIRGALVVAPNGVAPNWVRDELPAHLPDAVAGQTRVVLWDTDRANTQRYQYMLHEALQHEGLLIVVMSYDGIMTGKPDKAHKVKKIRRAFKGCHYAKEVLKSRPCMMVLDESRRIKAPDAQRTKRIQAFSFYAKYRRCLDGTPATNSPFDLFAQIRFLNPVIWRKIGCSTFSAFKTYFGEWGEKYVAGGRKIPELVEYQNLDDLSRVAAEVGSRLLKEDVLDLPPKLYGKRYFTMGKRQQAVYDELEHQFMALLEDGDSITAPLVVTQMMRLQQITSGYCPMDSGELMLFDDNPRIPALMDVVEDCPHQLIVWAKFRHDVGQIVNAAKAAGVETVRYDGEVNKAQREHARNAFQAGDAKLFVGNPACAGEGLTLHAARTVLRYNVSWKPDEVLQAEDRAHRIGQEHPVQYVDFIAEGSIDEKIIVALRRKKNLATEVMRDPQRAWV